MGEDNQREFQQRVFPVVQDRLKLRIPLNGQITAILSGHDVRKNFLYDQLKAPRTSEDNLKKKRTQMAAYFEARKEKDLVGSLAEKKLPTEECTGRNGEREKRVRSRRSYQMIDNIKIYGSYEETKRNAENRKD
ncbi:hypothetical protein ANN_18566 [Periplaneta americana]|uniref:Uncharacterized protein n=1 Tax=Periplaneta americana TaxID=6978 RepID=A0ABQ8SP37_PERAM|nr:hypothetical protein ANN_18566 [Periplaneta americana]